MMRNLIRVLCCAAALSLLCAAGNAVAQTALPPLNPSLGRVVIYRPWHYAGGASGSMIALNGKLVGICRAGKYFYVDTPPGTYYMGTYYVSLGAMVKAGEQTLAVHAGQTDYVKLNVGFAYSIDMVPANKATSDLASVHYDPSAGSEDAAQSAKHVAKALHDFEQYKQASGLDFAAAQQPASGPAAPAPVVASIEQKPAAPDTAAPPVSPPPVSAPPTPAPGPAAGPLASGARAALVVGAHCARDPDPIGLVSGSFYSGCKQKELNQVRTWIAEALAPRGVQILPGNAGFDYQFAVTITKDMDKRPSSLLPFSDWMPGTMVFEATYQVLDPAGHVLASGNVTHQGPDSHSADVEKKFAQMIAASLSNAQVATPAASTAPAAANSPMDQASLANQYEIVAQAYRSLAVKPPLSDNARAESRKAEDLLAAGNFKAAADAYTAILVTDHWWPEGFRGLALALGQGGDPADAILWMRRYLDFVPAAGDAAAMQAKVDAWSRQAPPPPPAALTAPPGLHLGVVCADTPGIVAMALGQPDLDGAWVVLVLPGSVAESAGLLKGDIVVSFDGAPVHSAADLVANAAKSAPGAVAKLVIQRGPARTTISLALPGPTPPAPAPKPMRAK